MKPAAQSLHRDPCGSSGKLAKRSSWFDGAVRAGARLALMGLLCGHPGEAAEQEAVDQQAFAAAARAFQDGVYDRAEQEFARFVEQHSQSPRLAEAVLYQARARLKQNKLAEGVALLTNNVAKAGPLADQYRYWQAEAYLRSSNYVAAAQTFALLVREFTNSVRLLEASYGEALARFKLGEMGRVVSLLQQPEGTFQQAVRVRANDELAVRGHLLLAEALLTQKQFKPAEQALSRLAEGGLIPEFKWHRQYLLCRVQMADNQLSTARAGVTNLLALAAAAGQRNLLAESVALEGEIHERAGDITAAIRAYEKNLADRVPPEHVRQALVKIIELSLAQDRIADAAQRLAAFLAKNPGDATSDLMLLTLGEVHLKLHLDGAKTNRSGLATNPMLTDTNAALASTNHLQAALAHFDKLLTTFTNSPFLGKAHLDRGWCLWLNDKIPESLAAFGTAAAHLPRSEHLAVARFKLADAQFFLNDYTNALKNYRDVVNEFGDFPRVKDDLFDHALYQMVRASLEVNDLNSATAAMKRILQEFPETSFKERSVLLVGQSYTAANRPAEARTLFTELGRRITDSPLLPEVELAIARTYVRENDWPGAIRQYQAWTNRFPNHELRPRAEFNLGWAYSQAGQETNALTSFTNFVAWYPSNTLAAEAQFWVGTYFFNQRDYVNAEKTFQDRILLQNTHFSRQARMMAGRAAFARQGWKDAGDYFRALVNDPGCPTNLLAEAFFALGDTFTRQEADAAKPLQKFDEARETFSKITLITPTSRLVPAAWGRIGDCFLQLASQDAKQYENATNAYGQAMNSPGASVGVRYQAEVGLGRTLEKMAQGRPASESTALRKAAFEHYYNIVSDKSLRDGESPDPYWYKEAALAAGSLAEERQEWEIAVNIYQRLLSVLPRLRPALEKRIEKAREHLSLPPT